MSLPLKQSGLVITATCNDSRLQPLWKGKAAPAKSKSSEGRQVGERKGRADSVYSSLFKAALRPVPSISSTLNFLHIYPSILTLHTTPFLFTWAFSLYHAQFLSHATPSTSPLPASIVYNPNVTTHPLATAPNRLPRHKHSTSEVNQALP